MNPLTAFLIGLVAGHMIYGGKRHIAVKAHKKPKRRSHARRVCPRVRVNGHQKPAKTRRTKVQPIQEAAKSA